MDNNGFPIILSCEHPLPSRPLPLFMVFCFIYFILFFFCLFLFLFCFLFFSRCNLSALIWIGTTKRRPLASIFLIFGFWSEDHKLEPTFRIHSHKTFHWRLWRRCSFSPHYSGLCNLHMGRLQDWPIITNHRHHYSLVVRVLWESNDC